MTDLLLSRYWELACDGWVGVSAPGLRENCVQLICGLVDEMLACSECAFKGSGSGDLVTLAVDGVEVQVFFQWQLTLDVLCDLIIRTVRVLILFLLFSLC